MCACILQERGHYNAIANSTLAWNNRNMCFEPTYFYIEQKSHDFLLWVKVWRHNWYSKGSSNDSFIHLSSHFEGLQDGVTLAFWKSDTDFLKKNSYNNSKKPFKLYIKIGAKWKICILCPLQSTSIRQISTLASPGYKADYGSSL